MSDKSYPFTGKVLQKHPGSPTLVAQFTDNSAKIGDTHAVIPEYLLGARGGTDNLINASISGTFEVIDGQSQVVSIDTISL